MKHAVSNADFFRQDALGALAAGPAHFTPRQREVLALLCDGLPNKSICRRLNIASGTVKVHISCIFRLLGVTSRLQAVVAAGSLGFPGRMTAQTPEPVGETPQGDREVKAAAWPREVAGSRLPAMAT